MCSSPRSVVRDLEYKCFYCKIKSNMTKYLKRHTITFKVSRLANTARSVVRDLDTGLFTSQKNGSIFDQLSILKMHCNGSLIPKNNFAWG